MRKPNKLTRAFGATPKLCQLILGTFMISQASAQLLAGEISYTRKFDQDVFVLRQGSTEAMVAPSSGANVFSIRVDGIEYLHQPSTAKNLVGVSCGVPLLYPTPNRVKNSSFTYGDQKVSFVANAGKNFIHGLVNRIAWKVKDRDITDRSATLVLETEFAKDNQLGAQFPFYHRLELSIEVSDSSVKWTYVVDNSGGVKTVPFGFALHPYFAYQGSRDETHLTIPATHWMEAGNDRLPSGELVSASELEFSLGSPLCLKDTKFDDVFWGMSGKRPTLIDFRETGRKITIHASDEFTHLVVWTPDRTFFGIESQTCSTDAHNLHAAGKTKEAHLQECLPGKSLSGWVEYRFESE